MSDHEAAKGRHRKDQGDEGFEKRLARLEEIVRKMEAGPSLDEAIKLYEEGTALSRSLTVKLSDVQRRIEVLIQERDGTIRTEPLSDQ